MDEIAAELADRGVSSVFVYTREAHPGEDYPHHDSFERKLAHAGALRDLDGVRRPILVDTLEGDLHHRYGLLPNMCFILSRTGRILYKAEWTDPLDVRSFLLELLGSDARELAPFYSERLSLRPNDPTAFMERLRRNGPKAVEDFHRSLRVPSPSG